FRPPAVIAWLNAVQRPEIVPSGSPMENRYAVLFRIQTVKKAETRARKIVEFVAMLERGERIHEPRKARAVKLKVSTG
ncbi:MAG: YdeI/OmpD-associated family protein, partial [Candidatus Sulfotelmatobacter sp.]